MSSISFWNGASGMRAFQSKMDVVSHNIANVNTDGYKGQRAAFDDLIRTQMNTNVEGNFLVGHGVKQEYTDNLMAQGSLTSTGQALDFALAGAGYFAVNDDGETQYTRNGAFYLSVEGANATLVTNDGARVLDRSNQIITLPYTNGTVDTTGLAERLGVFSFPNEYGLTPQTNSRFTVSDNSGEAQLLQPSGANGPNYDLIQGYLERSNVDLAREMVNIIESQRAFQMNSRVVQTADEIAQEVNNMR